MLLGSRSAWTLVSALALVGAGGAESAGGAARGPLRLDRLHGARFEFGGVLGERVKANVENWLLVAPRNNPGLLGMFARRDAGKPINLVPWAGEFVGKYLISGVQALRMSDDLLEDYIVQHIEAHPGATVTFSWHGGEPTILGLEYFRKIVALQRRHRPPGRTIANGIQTNGIVLDEDWCAFLAAEGFTVGLSLDGPAHRIADSASQYRRMDLIE